MKVTVTHSKLTGKAKERFVNNVTRRMLEIMKNQRDQENSKPKGLDKNGKKRYNPSQSLGKGGELRW